MNRSRITGAILLRLEDCASILSQHLAKFLNRPIQLRSVVEDYDYWCVVLENEYLSVAELRPLLCEISATLEDFPDLFPDHSDRTRSFSMELSRALLQHAMHANWRYEHLTEDYDEMDADNFREWADSTKHFDRLLAAFPDRAWLE